MHGACFQYRLWVGRLVSLSVGSLTFRSRQRLEYNVIKLHTTEPEKLETSIDTVSALRLHSVDVVSRWVDWWVYTQAAHHRAGKAGDEHRHGQ